MIRMSAVGQSLAGAIACAALMVGCGSESTGPSGPTLTPSRAVVSSPGDDGLVYVSLEEIGTSTAPAIVSNHRTGASFQTQLVSSGFDPMTIAANVGDTLWITLRFSTKDSAITYAVVPASSQATVMRTLPANGANGVNVLDSIVAIFSEPVDLSSLAGGVHLQPIEGSPLAATLSQCGAPWCVKLVPSVPLPGYSTFQFSGSATVTSRSGTVAAQPFAASFTTGTPTNWPAALGPPPLVIKSYKVIEYEALGDTIHYYSPLLTVSNSGTASIDLSSFEMSLPGIGTGDWGPCDSITVAPGDTAEVFLALGSLYDVAMGSPGRRATGNATGTLQYATAGYVANLDLTSAVTAGEPPPANTNAALRWYAYCP